MAMISRDPFARQELHRTVLDTIGSCAWCGGFRERNGRNLKRMFKYYTETDGGRRYEHRGVFCSKSCHDSYHCD